jgi:(R,R)-butanediol dehydrogenase / meso-butanediol dehydrogenase / diacetyl reductase
VLRGMLLSRESLKLVCLYWEVNSGQSALIIGAGPIGLAVLLCLKAFGAKTIIISEIATLRKAQAEKFGADVVLDPTKVDVVTKAKELCDGLSHRGQIVNGSIGPHMSFDCSGSQITQTTAIKSIRARGIAVTIALIEKPMQYNPEDFMNGEIKYVASCCYTPEEYEEVINAVAEGTPHTKLTQEKSNQWI